MAESINLDKYLIHPFDAAALKTMRALPGFDTAANWVAKEGAEHIYRGKNMASNVRLSSRQLPELYGYLPPLCRAMAINEPEMFLNMDPFPYCHSFGRAESSYISVSSGLVNSMEPGEIKAALAHECGHIKCRHSLYRMMLDIINMGAGLVAIIPAPVLKPLEGALNYWSKMSDFSADRVAVLLTSPEDTIGSLLKLAGGSCKLTGQIDIKEFAEQAKECEEYLDGSFWKKAIKVSAVYNSDSSLAALRVNEILKWRSTSEYGEMRQILDRGIEESKRRRSQLRSEELLANRQHLPHLTYSDVAAYFIDNSRLLNGMDKYMAAVPTPELMRGLTYTPLPPGYERSSLLLMAFSSKSEDIYPIIKLITYQTLDQKLQDLLRSSGKFLIEI